MGPLAPWKLSNSLAVSLTLVSSCVISSLPLLFFTPSLCLHSQDFFLYERTQIHTLSFSLSSSWPPDCPPPGVIVVFRVRQEPQSLRPPQCLPGSTAAIIRQLVLANRLKQLWKTALALTSPCILLLANGKAGYRKNNTVE